jgi:hypothetical protein
LSAQIAPVNTLNAAELFSTFLSWVSIVPTEAWVGFGGVILGGVISIATTSHFTKREHQRTRKGEAIAVALKASLIANDFAVLHQEFKDAQNKHKAHNDQRRPFWTFRQSKAGRYERITIDATELLVFIEAREYAIVQQLVVLGMRHKAVCDALNDFSDAKRELRAHVTGGTQVGDYMLSNMDDFDQPTQIIITQLMSLSRSAADLLPTFSAEARTLCASITPALRRHLKDDSIPFFARPDQ